MLTDDFTMRRIKKTYLAKVVGHFPDYIESHQPIKVISSKLALNAVSPTCFVLLIIGSRRRKGVLDCFQMSKT